MASSIIRTVDKLISSPCEISNQILVAGSPVSASANINGTITVHTNLQPNFGSCGWNQDTGMNKIPFYPDCPLKISSFPKTNWIYKCPANGKTITYSNNLIDNDTHIHLYMNLYADLQCPITHTKSTIELQTTPVYAISTNVTKFKLKNIKQLDLNEYYYNYKDDTIIIKCNSRQQLYLSEGTCIFNIQKTSNVKFTGVTFMGAGIIIQGCNNISFNNCKFINIPKTAISIKASSNINITNCTFTSIGYGAIDIQSCGNYNNLTNANITIDSCSFVDCNITKYTNAFYINTNNSVGLTISNCLFKNSTSAAINSKSNDTTVVGCHFVNCCSDTDDYGIIYEGRTFTRRGLVISKCIFDLLPYSGISPKYAVYLDDGYSGTKIQECTFDSIKSPNACIMGFGRYTDISRCVFYHSECAFKIPRPRMPGASCITEYKQLMDDQAKKKLFISKYPELSEPIDLSKGYLVPYATFKNNIIHIVGGADNVYKYLNIAKEGTCVVSNNICQP